jgi:hypothetical protein
MFFYWERLKAPPLFSGEVGWDKTSSGLTEKLNRHSRHRWLAFLSGHALFYFRIILEAILFLFSPSAEQLRAKSGKTMMALSVVRA